MICVTNYQEVIGTEMTVIQSVLEADAERYKLQWQMRKGVNMSYI